MGKAFYSWTIQRDKKIEGTVMRSTTIPEELGRIQYVLADKTGTLTKNEMVFQKLHLGNALFDKNNFYEVSYFLLLVVITCFCTFQLLYGTYINIRRINVVQDCFGANL